MRASPPRTMTDVARSRLRAGAGAAAIARPDPARPSGGRPPAAGRARARPARNADRSRFPRVRSPLVDVFDEPEEVLVVVDLGGFTRGEISLTMTPRQYTIRARRGDHTFEEVIRLPRGVDPDRARERFVHGILEIAVPRRTPRRRRAPARGAAARSEERS